MFVDGQDGQPTTGGAASALEARYASVELRNLVVRGLDSTVNQYAIHLQGSNGVVEDLVMEDNTIFGVGFVASGTGAEELVLRHSIAADNAGGVAVRNDAVAQYNDTFGNAGRDIGLDDATLQADPKFVDPAGGDYTPEPGFSPCIDAGNPLSGYNDADGTRNDMGAYGGPGGGR